MEQSIDAFGTGLGSLAGGSSGYWWCLGSPSSPPPTISGNSMLGAAFIGLFGTPLDRAALRHRATGQPAGAGRARHPQRQAAPLLQVHEP
ncbi:MAG: hypothetical protein U5L98_05035 [Halomonas sp.]|uniref:hypothetical protein n=1 Tax=Halomonas sp. TaxID=1486246 RepID=UPI002ACE2168|nr:hypothetical protein [Halomonas sp.]MDZ7852018.1 hypothetical protein [Halomonas sp.]